MDFLKKLFPIIKKYVNKLLDERLSQFQGPPQPEQVQDNKWKHVYAKIENTVVQILTTSQGRNWLNSENKKDAKKSTGTGFFVKHKGNLLILTNYHVIHNAIVTKIKIPAYKVHSFEVNVIGIAPDRDVALLELTPQGKKELLKLTPTPPFLELGDSDELIITDDIMAVGYPFGLRSTSFGTVSGFVVFQIWAFVQLTAAINPGNSGGPSFTSDGKVVGINSRGITGADGMGFFIPIKEVKSIMDSMVQTYYGSNQTQKKIIRYPTLDAILQDVTKELAEHYGLPKHGGQLINKIFKNSVLIKAGFRENDIIYQINGHLIDSKGGTQITYQTVSRGSRRKRMTLYELLTRKTMNQKIELVVYRNKKPIKGTIQFTETQRPIRVIYPKFENEEIYKSTAFAGMFVTNLRESHIDELIRDVIKRSLTKWPSHFSYLVKYKKTENQDKNLVVITYVKPNSRADKTGVLYPGVILDQMNGVSIRTMDQFIKVFKGRPQTIEFKTKHEKKTAIIHLQEDDF